jgi:hypothetical protein
MRAMRVLILALVAVALLVSTARAQELPGAGSVSVVSAETGQCSESHAWVALPLPAGEGAILHLPPRIAAGQSDADADAEDGSVRLGTRLSSMPEALAAWENRLWMVFPAEGPAANRQRRVLTMSVERGPMDGSWSSPDAEGRLPALPSLPGDQTLVAFAGAPRGPLALLRAEGPEPKWSMLWFSGTQWVAVTPPGSWTASARVGLAAAPAGAALVAMDAGRVMLWRGAVDGTTWRWREQAIKGGIEALPESKRIGAVLVRDQGLLTLRDADKRLQVWSLDRSGSRLLTSVDTEGRPAAAVPLDQVGRIAMVWAAAPREPAGVGLSARIVEVSALTGAVLYDGPAKVAGPVSSTELKLLALALVAVMAAVLVFVMQPDASGPELSLPRGFALAEPGRRFGAAAIDLLIVLAVVGRLRGIPLAEFAAPSAFFQDRGSVETVLMLIGVGFAYSTVSEWLFGRGIGKWVAGCRVAAWGVGPADASAIVVARPSLWRAAVRNVVRWVLPPLAISGLLSADHRHRGDLSAGTVVVVRVEPETPAPAG